VLDAIIRATCRQSNRNSTQNELRRKSEPWTPRRRTEKKERIKKLRLFSQQPSLTKQKKDFLTSTTLGTALQRVEPDDPQHPVNKRPGGHHVPEKASGGATPRPQPPRSRAAKAGKKFQENEADFTARKQSSSGWEGIAADSGRGAGKESDLMGQGAEEGKEREGGGVRLLVLVFSEQTTAWSSLSFFLLLGFWMGVVWLRSLSLHAGVWCFSLP
jgi:hypothetical protein